MNYHLLELLCKIAIEKPPEIRNFRIASAIVFKHKEMVSLGFPRRKTHPMQKRFGVNSHAIFLHAEVEALIRAMRITKLNAKDYSVYVARVKQRGPLDYHNDFIKGDATPCSGCTEFIHYCGLSKVVRTLG